ncbi:MAG: LacI family DNA-binding transcriptional regulator [Paucibacter sp.]|nr:LacI family DNA-binding transcriptional regulator [Roseateles sp.]
MPTIKDVAKLAGVGVGTASRVLSGKGSVAPATAEKVRRAIEQLEFKPSLAARSLMTGASQTIGVYIPFLKGTYYTTVLQVIDKTLRAHGMHMVVAFGQDGQDEREEAVLGMRFLIERQCDGLMVFSNLIKDADIRGLKDAAQHVAVINSIFPRLKEQCFSADHEAAGRLAAQALLRHQHRDIAVVCGPATSPDNAARMRGFMAELGENGVPAKRVLELQGDFSTESGWRAGVEALASGRRFTAVFCANDEMAMGLMASLQAAGVLVPEEVSVLGYDDNPGSVFTTPRLSSVHIPTREVTQAGLNWLLNRRYGMTLPVQRDYPMSVSWRDSVTSAQPEVQRRSRKDRKA